MKTHKKRVTTKGKLAPITFHAVGRTRSIFGWKQTVEALMANNLKFKRAGWSDGQIKKAAEIP